MAETAARAALARIKALTRPAPWVSAGRHQPAACWGERAQKQQAECRQKRRRSERERSVAVVQQHFARRRLLLLLLSVGLVRSLWARHQCRQTQRVPWLLLPSAVCQAPAQCNQCPRQEAQSAVVSTTTTTPCRLLDSSPCLLHLSLNQSCWCCGIACTPQASPFAAPAYRTLSPRPPLTPPAPAPARRCCTQAHTCHWIGHPVNPRPVAPSVADVACVGRAAAARQAGRLVRHRLGVTAAAAACFF